MYLFRPLKTTQCIEKFLVTNAFSFAAYTPPREEIVWSEEDTYAAGAVAGERGSDFISLINDNRTRPYRNFIGRIPRLDDTSWRGNDTWIRLWGTNKYACLSGNATGFTQSRGNYGVTITPSMLGLFPYAKLLYSEDLCLLCSGIVGESLRVTAHYSKSGSVSDYTVINEDVYEEIDFALNPEIPSRASSFLFPFRGGYNTSLDIASAISVYVAALHDTFADKTVSYMENILVGRLSHIGKTQWTNYTQNSQDRSKINTDAWGSLTLSRRKVSRRVDFEVILTPTDSLNIVEVCSNVNKLLMYSRGTICSFILNNIGSMESDKLKPIPYGDVVTGLLKAYKISSFSPDKALLSMSIESIPSAFLNPDIPTIDAVPAPPPPSGIIHVSSVALSDTHLYLDVGEETTLTATVLPIDADDQSIAWSSSDTSVATVVDGLVTAVGEGFCVISAKATDGGISDSCYITAEIPERPPYNPDVLQFVDVYTADNNILQFIDHM